MKLFLDTNIFMEYLEEREQYTFVEQIFTDIANKKVKAIISAGCLS